MATTKNGAPYPLGTDRLMDGDDVIHNLAQWVDDQLNTACRMGKTASVSQPSGAVWTPVAWDQVSWDTKTMWSAANPTRFTLPYTGKYLCIATIQWQGTATPVGGRYLAWGKNGSPFYFTVTAPVGNSLNTVCQVVCTLGCAAGDYLEVMVQQSQGAALNIGGSGSSNFAEVHYRGLLT